MIVLVLLRFDSIEEAEEALDDLEMEGTILAMTEGPPQVMQ